MRQLNNLHTLVICKCLTSELNLGAGSSPFSLSKLKFMSLSIIKVSKISISQECCPVLETLEIASIDCLTDIEVIPTTVKELHLKKCKNLKDIKGIVGLVNIVHLEIKMCPELDAPSSFEQSASLKEFVLRGCYGVKRIHCLRDCKALEELRLDTRWEVEGIESLQPLEKLKCVELRANRRSAVEVCIQSMQNSQKWPGEMLICTRAVHDAASLINSFAFPTVSLIDFISDNNITSRAKLVQQRLPIEDAVTVEEGRWFWIGLFTQHSRYHAIEKYYVNTFSVQGEVEKGLLVMGEEQPLMQIFHDLWTLIAN